MPADTRKLDQRLGRMVEARRNFDSLWQAVAEVTLPDKGNFQLDVTAGAERRRSLYDATPVWANELFSAMLVSQLINPSIKWFALQSEQRGLEGWLEATREAVLRVLSAPGSQFVPAAHESFLELGAFGTGILFVGEREGRLVFRSVPLSEVWIDENEHGEVDVLARRRRLSVAQLASIYGEKALPPALLRSLEKSPEEQVSLVFMVLPRTDRDARRLDSGNMPWASVHYLPEHKHVLLESGYREFPYMVPRWLRVPGEVYGRGPGVTALPDSRMLQRMKEVTIRGAQKAIDPPLVAPDNGIIGPVRTFPGGVTVQRQGLRREDALRPLEHGARPDIGEQMMETVRDAISRMFFVDLSIFQRPEPRVSATAIIDKRDDRALLMTPMIARMQREFLAPLLDRVMALMGRLSILPPLPPGVDAADVEVEFVSPAQQAQMITEADNMTRFLELVAPVIQLDPASAENFDRDAFVQHMGRAFTIPSDVLVPIEQVKRKRAELEQQQQAQQEGQEVAVGAQTASTFSEALKNVAQADAAG